MHIKLRSLALLFLLFFVFPAESEVSLPVIGQNSAYQIESERMIGLRFKQRLIDEHKIIEDPLVDFYLNEILSIILQGLEKNYRRYQISVINDKSINAFAVPGGFIGINYGLILATQTEAQLAGVLSHEIAHILLNHLSQLVERQGEVSKTLLASFFLALVLSQASDVENKGEAIEAILLGGSASAQQSMINFTRENEYEADRKGLTLMNKSGYPAIGMAEFFSILEGRAAGGEFNSIEYLRTHPISENRMGEAYQFNVKNSVSHDLLNDEYNYLKVYLNHITGAESLIQTKSKNVTLFQEALRSIHNSQYDKAVIVLKALNNIEKENIWFVYTLVKMQQQLNEHDDALTVLQSALEIYPKKPLLLGLKINVLMAKGENRAALKIGLELLEKDNKNQQVRYNLVKAYEQLGLKIKARQLEGDYHFENGSLERAKYLYLRVMKKTNDSMLKKLLGEKIKKIDGLLKK